MAIEDYGLNISQFEELLQKITANMASGIIFERLPPSELWSRSETDVTSLRGLAERLKETMLILKPERAPTIEKRFRALLQPLNDFREILFQKSDDPLANSRLALELLRRAVMEGSDFLDVAKEIRKNPSESILAVLKLKEIYGAKEYLSTITIPETVYARFTDLRRNLEDFKIHISDLEQALGELKKHLDSVQEEISKFRPPSTEASLNDKKSLEPALTAGDKQ